MITKYTRTTVACDGVQPDKIQFVEVPFSESTHTEPGGLNRQAALNIVNEWNRIALMHATKPGRPLYIYTVD